MRKRNFLLPTLLTGFVCMLAPPAMAAGGPACSSAATGSVAVLPIDADGQTYCQSAFGWSDRWYPTAQPSNSTLSLDVFSGDDALGVNFVFRGNPINTGNNPAYNVISPFLDAGTLNATSLGTNWNINTDISVTGNVATSEMSLALGTDSLIADITTTVLGNGITEAVTFTNDSGFDLTDFTPFDYYNFHPDGSATTAAAACGTTAYAGGVVTTTGSSGASCSEIVSSGTMWGQMGTDSSPDLPATCSLGSVGNVLTAMSAASPIGCGTAFAGDGAANLGWDFGTLANGSSVTLTITKDFTGTSIPEPASLTLLGFGLLGAGLLRRRRA